MRNVSKALTRSVISFIIFHAILSVMWGEHREYWYLYTGIMLIAGTSYVLYQRDTASKRLLTPIDMGIITSVVLTIIQLIFSLISSELSYTSSIRELSRAGVYFKWQMLVTLLFVIPCHGLYMRAVSQKELIKYDLPKWASILVVTICSSSLFIYLDNWWIVFFIFVAQFILFLSYGYTKHIATTTIGQIMTIILLLTLHG